MACTKWPFSGSNVSNAGCFRIMVLLLSYLNFSKETCKKKVISGECSGECDGGNTHHRGLNVAFTTKFLLILPPHSPVFPLLSGTLFKTFTSMNSFIQIKWIWCCVTWISLWNPQCNYFFVEFRVRPFTIKTQIPTSLKWVGRQIVKVRSNLLFHLQKEEKRETTNIFVNSFTDL